MREFTFLAVSATMAVGMMAQSRNGSVVNGELILQDFEGDNVEVSAWPLKVAVGDRDQDSHKCDFGVVEYKGSKMGYALSAYFHRLAADPEAQGPWSSDVATLFVKVTLPAGHTLADFKGFRIDYANYYPDKSTVKGSHGLFVTSGNPDDTYKLVGKVPTVENIDNGDVYTQEFTMQDINTTQIFQQKKFVADKWSGEFWIAYCPDKNNNGFYIDNIRLTGAEGLGGVENVSATAAGALSYYAGDGAIRVEGVGHVTVYSVTGVEVAAADVDGTSTIAVAPGMYVVKAPAAPAAKLIVK